MVRACITDGKQTTAKKVLRDKNGGQQKQRKAKNKMDGQCEICRREKTKIPKGNESAGNGPQRMEEVDRDGPDALGYKGYDKKKKKKKK